MTGNGRLGLEQLERIRRDPVGAFLRDVLGYDAWSKQREVIESVRDHRRTAVRSGHGVGKTSVAARCVLWWLSSWPEAIAVTTSATWTLVREQLWRELAAGVHDSHGFFRGWTLTDTRLESGPDHFAIGLSTDTPERFAGWHSERLLVVLDEASGVNEATWETAETLLTSPASRLLAIGNPLRVSGAFHRAFTTERALYNLIGISALESPAVTGEPVSDAVRRRLVSPEWIADRRRAWGERSPLYQVRVLGEFPATADDTVCSISEVEAAQRRKLPVGVPLVVGCDVARFGSDETVIVVRRGGRVRIVKAYVGRDTMRTAGEVARVGRELAAEADTDRENVRVVVDDVGIGGAVTDRLRELGEFTVVAFNGGGAAHDPLEYPNRRSEVWFSLADRLPGLDLDGDEQLAADLVAPRYAIDSRGRRVVETKAETKRRLGRSPDRADAVVMAVGGVRDEAWSPQLSAWQERELARAYNAERDWDDTLRTLEQASGIGLEDELRW